MLTMFYKIIATSLLLQTMVITSTSAEILQEYTKKISENFSFSTDAPSIDLSNKYGDVDITISNSNSATVEILITVEAKNESRGQEILDRIDIILDHSDSELEVETELSDMKTKRNESFQIDYKIAIPRNSGLTLYNKYGDISVATLNTDADIEVHYGNGSIADINGNLDLEMSYGKRFTIGTVSGDIEAELSYAEVIIEGCRNFEAESKYSEFDIENTGTVRLDTKYSEYTFGTVKTIDYQGKYDHVHVEHVDKIFFDGKYSHLDAEVLTSSLESNTGYGSVKISQVESGFQEIIIESDYTSNSIKIEGDYKVDIESKYTGVNYPDNMNIRNREKDGNELTLKGSVGNGGNGKLTARMKYGKLNLR